MAIRLGSTIGMSRRISRWMTVHGVGRVVSWLNGLLLDDAGNVLTDSNGDSLQYKIEA